MLTISIWIFQEIILSKYTPRNFEALFSFVLFCSSFLFLVELNKEYFVLEIFQNSLLALCQVATFCSSSSIILKTFSLLLSQVNKIASYANITGVQLLIGSLTYMRNKVVQWWSSVVNRYVLQYMLFSFLPNYANCCLCFK